MVTLEKNEINAKAEIFDINNYLNGRTNRPQIKVTGQKEVAEKASFKDIVRQLIEFFNEKFEDNSLPDKDRQERQQVEHKAMMGDHQSKLMLIEDIQGYIRDNNIHGVKFPSMYESLAHAIFEQIFRFKEFYKWSQYPDSPSAMIAGKEMWFKINGKFVKQKEELDSVEDVYEIIRMLQQGDRTFQINEKNPQGELDLEDGTRVTLTIPPRTAVPTIVFRKFIVNQFSFTEQARRNTIAKEDKRLFEILAKVRLNMIFAGAVESGKSTMLKTFYAERPSDLVALSIEEHAEGFFKRDFPDRLMNEFYVKDGDIKRVLRTILRFDHDYVIFQEVRGVEADAAIDGASRGATGLLMTYHVTEPEDVVEQLAQHIIDEFPNRRNINEIRRVARTLHVGLTMENVEIGGKSYKKMTNLYEICYDVKTDEAWIQYIIKYNEEKNEWFYNPSITDKLIKRLKKTYKDEPSVVQEFLEILFERASVSPMPTEEIKKQIYFKEGE